ncbi:hypothetical protein GCM10023196_098220 [Actinoallomurus vinaceus]|uniref:Uncharacterized protein n=1 Tax=Actinoallomurus vinaceus TaxID=1080074 RepID=A0ABP8UUK9_9ACTN
MRSTSSSANPGRRRRVHPLLRHLWLGLQEVGAATWGFGDQHAQPYGEEEVLPPDVWSAFYATEPKRRH